MVGEGGAIGDGRGKRYPQNYKTNKKRMFIRTFSFTFKYQAQGGGLFLLPRISRFSSADGHIR